MQGLDLSRTLYAERGRELLDSLPRSISSRMAVGLVGEGSECFGFDDEISRDHDWGAAFCIWMPQAELDAAMVDIEAALARLPKTFMGFPVRMEPEARIGRVGPISIEAFYGRFLNVPRAPETLAEWRRVPEHYLAVATNGEVFSDPAGEFSAIRETLLAFYPEDIRRKKIAARCVAAAQAGQYNLPRMLSRYDYVAAAICRARFAEAVISLAFLLSRRYMPFYKWAFRAVKLLPGLGMDIGFGLERLMTLSLMDAGVDQVAERVESLCQLLADTLLSQGLTDSNDPWLYEQGPRVQAGITHAGLRAIPVQLE